MNCKPGDLAVVVWTYHPKQRNAGAIVECVSWFVDVDGSPRWNIRPITRLAGFEYTCDDKCLRPIRDNDGEDETLTWAGKPESINA